MSFLLTLCFSSVQDFRSSQPGDGDKEVQILIPQPFMGTIIGTGGTKIKDLRQVRALQLLCSLSVCVHSCSVSVWAPSVCP